MPIFLRGVCPSCRGSVEATVDRPDELVECLRCGGDLQLSAAAAFRAHCRRRRLLIGLVLVGGVLVLLGFLAYHYRASLRSGFETVVTETGGKKAAWICLSASLIGSISLLLWMFFPIALYLALKDLRRRTSGLEEAHRACARHLARLSREQSVRINDPPKAGPV